MEPSVSGKALEVFLQVSEKFGIEWALIFILLGIIVYLFRRSEQTIKDIHESNLVMMNSMAKDAKEQSEKLSQVIESSSNKQVVALQQVQNVVSKLEGAFTIGFSRRDR